MSSISKRYKSSDSQLTEFNDSAKKNIYKETTKNIDITVWPEFVDGQNTVMGGLFVWIYEVRIDNNSEENIKLINRHWRIIDEQGIIQEVDGEGVVGEKPSIAPGAFFQYSSGVHLRNPSGVMSGHYQFKKDNGELFDAKIPAFSLDAPSSKAVVN